MSDFFIPSSPQDLTLKSLTKGMDSSIPTKDLLDGSFLKISGFDVVDKGLQRHGAWRSVLTDSTTGYPVPVPFELPADERVEDILSMLMTTGVSRSFLITNRFLYRVIRGASGSERTFTPIFWKQEFTAASYTPGTRTLVVASDLIDIEVDDDCYVWSESDLGVAERHKISTISFASPDTTIVLADDVASWPTDNHFKILKPFLADSEFFVDYTIGNYTMYLVDGHSPLVFSFDGGAYLDYVEITSSAGVRTMYGARSVTWYSGMLFFCDVTEPNQGTTWYHRQRVRWTDPLNPTISEAGWYQDLTQGQGSIIKIFGLGPVIAAYQEDAVYIGRQTNLSGLPYAFEQVNTGGISLVGMKAVDAYFNGQIWVGRDDIYVISSDGSISKIGTPVAHEAIINTAELWRTVVRADPLNFRIIVGVSRQGQLLDSLFFFNIRTKAWSMQDDPNLAFQAINTLRLTDETSWSEVTGTWAVNDLALTAWFEMTTGIRFARLHAIMPDNRFVEYSSSDSHHRLPIPTGILQTPVVGYIETQDLTFGAADSLKTLLRFGFDIEEYLINRPPTDGGSSPRANRILLRLEWSEDRGRTWKRVGHLTYNPADDEDALNFRATASTIRLRATIGLWELGGDNDIQPYFITAINARVRGRGGEGQIDTTRPQSNA